MTTGSTRSREPCDARAPFSRRPQCRPTGSGAPRRPAHRARVDVSPADDASPSNAAAHLVARERFHTPTQSGPSPPDTGDYPRALDELVRVAALDALPRGNAFATKVSSPHRIPGVAGSRVDGAGPAMEFARHCARERPGA